MNELLNDIKLEALNFQNGNITDHIDDAELEYLHNLIIDPDKAGQVNDAWIQHFDELGITAGGFNDRAARFIKSILPLSEAETMNALWLDYWTSLLP